MELLRIAEQEQEKAQKETPKPVEKPPQKIPVEEKVVASSERQPQQEQLVDLASEQKEQ